MRKNHKTKDDWLFSVHQKCPVWRAQFRRFYQNLCQDKKATYRHFAVFLSGQHSFIVEGQKGNASHLTQRNLFWALHGDIEDLLKALSQDENTVSLEVAQSLLSSLWPDKAWKVALVQRVGAIRGAKNRKERVFSTLRPLVFARRTDSLLLQRKNNTWHTEKGTKLESIIKRSRYSKAEALKVLSQLPGLSSMEIPKGKLKWSYILREAKNLRRALRSKNAYVKTFLAQENEWHVAFRRLHKMGLNGCFDCVTNTIIVDPRSFETLKHEFCHMVLGHNLELSEKKATEAFEYEACRLESLLF